MGGMMARNRIKFDSAGFGIILRGAGTRGAVHSVASRIQASVPESTVRVMQGGYGGGRVVGFVTTNPASAEDAVLQREALESAVLGGA